MPRDARRNESRAGFAVRTGRTPSRFVLDSLQEHGGRLRQTELADRSGLHPETLSAILAELESEEAVVRFRAGRGNLVSLPEHDPRSTGSA